MNKILQRAYELKNSPASDFIKWSGRNAPQAWCVNFASTLVRDAFGGSQFNDGGYDQQVVSGFFKALKSLGFNTRTPNVGVAQPGDIIFLDDMSHVAICAQQSGSTVKTIGGNQGAQGKGDNWSEKPDYANYARTKVTVMDMSRFNSNDPVPTPPAPQPQPARNIWIADYQAALGGIAVDGIWGPQTANRCNQSLAGLPYKTPKQTTVIQRKLGLPVDGIFGNKTAEAVKQFQRNNGLSVDGIVGANTAQRLFA